MPTPNFNPFARSKMKIVEPLTLVSVDFSGWDSSYRVKYRASRGAANVGLLSKQFQVGTPLVLSGKHVVVRNAKFTYNPEAADEVFVDVEAVDFATVLASAMQSGKAPVATATAPSLNNIRPAGGRRILQ